MKIKLHTAFSLLSLFAFFFLLPSISKAQTYSNYKNASNKVLKQYDKGKAMLKANAIDDAERFFKNALREDDTFIDAYIRLGDIYLAQKKYNIAIEQYQKVIQLDSTYSLRLHYSLGNLYYNLDQYEAAIPALSFFAQRTRNDLSKKNAEILIERSRFAMEAIQNPVPFTPTRLPATINTPGSEYLPSFTADGKQLVYTAVRNGQEDFYFTEKINGKWEKGKPLFEINTLDNEGAQTMSADGKVIVFTGCQRRDGFGSCDLYISYKKENYWTKPMNMGRQINSRAWDSQPSLSANGEYLFFASNRSGGNGKSDIYVSFREENGRWSSPQNLGPGINTPEDDKGPFFHADSRTLYFVSAGWPGMGGLDLYKTTLLGDANWAPPINLGFPINTKGDESTLIVSLDGKKGYFASNQFNINLETTDIYEFEIYEEIRPFPVTYLEASVIDATTKKPLQAKVELYDVISNNIFYKEKTDQDGQFLVCLAIGNEYGLNIEKEGYLFHSENFNLEQARQLEDPYHMIIELQPIIPVAAIQEEEIMPVPVVLKNIFFASASAELLPKSFKELNKLYQLLADNPAMKIRVDGHTDDVGSEEDNQLLSQNRAKAVYNFLIEKGIQAERLAYQGFGESKPIATNDTAEGRQKNRRTAFLVIE